MLKVFITNTHCYAQSNLVGKWVELPTSNENLSKEVKDVLSHGGEEYFISAFEGGIYIDENVNVMNLNEILQRADGQKDEFIAIMECLSVDLNEGIEILEDGAFHMIPEIIEMKEAAEILVEEGYYGEIPDHLANFLNYESIANDMVTAKGWKYSSKATAAICRA